ncbi:MAG: hypothetical protein LBR61_08160 [Synergistaceae bacterium]|jgi:hypothetical protein|nr:hypothetical protein [Synergistaceae bacterium]
MSLWEKWERDKLEKQGIKVDIPRDVQVLPTRVKKDPKKQVWFLGGAFLACIVTVLLALLLGRLLGWNWSDTYIAHVFAAKELQRENISSKSP